MTELAVDTIMSQSMFIMSTRQERDNHHFPASQHFPSRRPTTTTFHSRSLCNHIIIVILWPDLAPSRAGHHTLQRRRLPVVQRRVGTPVRVRRVPVYAHGRLHACAASLLAARSGRLGVPSSRLLSLVDVAKAPTAGICALRKSMPGSERMHHITVHAMSVFYLFVHNHL